MIFAEDFKNSIIIELGNDIYKIVEFKHIKPSNGDSFVRTKLVSITNGDMIEKSFKPKDQVEKADIEKKDMQFLFKDDSFCHFMDIESYEQIDVPNGPVIDSLRFVKENEMVKVCSYKGSIFDVEPPLFIELRVTETEAVSESEQSVDSTKPAKVETGATIDVPGFVQAGDIIKIDSRTGEYLSRV